tara:strand:+ start:152 stop:451 length:300 start_codon:yes stop_codon:yes gene_type:complete
MMTYEEKQLQRLNLKGVHPLKIVVHDDQGNKTNFMNLNKELLNALRVIETIHTKVVERANELLLEDFKAQTSNEVYKKEGMNIEQAIETSWKTEKEVQQ